MRRRMPVVMVRNNDNLIIVGFADNDDQIYALSKQYEKGEADPHSLVNVFALKKETYGCIINLLEETPARELWTSLVKEGFKEPLDTLINTLLKYPLLSQRDTIEGNEVCMTGKLTGQSNTLAMLENFWLKRR